jgi:hypothetical protein
MALPTGTGFFKLCLEKHLPLRWSAGKQIRLESQPDDEVVAV